MDKTKSENSWVPTTTVVKPFKFESRPIRSSIMKERTRYDIAVKKRLEEAELKCRFKAEPVPLSTTGAYMEQQQQEADERREMLHAKRAEWLMKQNKPPRCYYGEDKRPPRYSPPKPKTFKAKPVPAFVMRNKLQTFAVEDMKRHEKNAARAKQTLQDASLPPRQAAHEAEKKKQEALHESDPRAAELADVLKRMREQRIGVQYFEFQPRINPSTPDFEALHQSFETELRELKQSKVQTQLQPFNFKEEDQSSMERVMYDMQRDEQTLPETRWPHMSSRIAAERVPCPRREKEGSPRSAKWGGGAKTKSQLGRERKVKQDRLDRMIAARVVMDQESKRAEQSAAANRQVSSALKNFEVQRKKAAEVQQEMLEERAAEVEEKTKRWYKTVREIKSKSERRTMLFEQASAQSKREKMLHKFDETLVNEGLGHILAVDS